MDLDNFISGEHITQIGYKSFKPEKINHSWIVSSCLRHFLFQES